MFTEEGLRRSHESPSRRCRPPAAVTSEKERSSDCGRPRNQARGIAKALPFCSSAIAGMVEAHPGNNYRNSFKSIASAILCSPTSLGAKLFAVCKPGRNRDG
jgi:hypothetical protein